MYARSNRGHPIRALRDPADRLDRTSKPELRIGVSAQTQNTKNEFENDFSIFLCDSNTPLPHPSRHTKDTKDLDWEPVWEPDGEPADVPDPRLRMGPSSSGPSGALRTTVGHLLHPNSGCWQPAPNAGFTEEQPQELK